MSNILVQNIKHTNNTTSMAIDTSGQVTIRGESSATTTNLQQGLAKAYHHTNSATSLQDSFNISGTTDHATGDYEYSFSNSMRLSGGYSAPHTIHDDNSGHIRTDDCNTGSMRILINNGDGSADRDRRNGGAVHGDLA